MKKSKIQRVILLIMVLLGVFLLASCTKKQEEKPKAAKEMKELPAFPTEESPPAVPDPAPEEKQPKQKPIEKTQDPESASGKEEVPKPQMEQQKAEEKIQAKKEPVKFPIKVVFDTHGEEIREPIQILDNDRVLAEVSQTEFELMIDSTYFGKKLLVKASFFKPSHLLISPNVNQLQIDLEALFAQIKVYDSMDLYPNEIGDVHILYEGNLLGKTNPDGLASINIPHYGTLKLQCYKDKYFKKKTYTLKINSPDKLYSIGLEPVEHFVQIRLVDDEDNPLKNKSVELFGGKGIMLRGVTNENGVVRLKHYKLIAANNYTLTVPTHDIRIENFAVTDELLDAADKVFTQPVSLKYDWTIEADIEVAELELYDSNGQLITSGKGFINTKLPRGIYKIVATHQGRSKREIFNSATPPYRKKVVLMHPYDSAMNWLKENPGKPLPKDYLAGLIEISGNDSRFIDSRLLLGKSFIAYKEYNSAVKAYEDIFASDMSARYKPDLLYQMAQALMLRSENEENNQKERTLKTAVDQYCDNALAYLSKLPMASRPLWAMKIQFLKAEINQRLYNLMIELDRPQDKANYKALAKDQLSQFIRDYESLPGSSELKTRLKNDYYRAKDLYSALQSSAGM